LFKLPASKVVPDAEGYYSFIGRFDGDDQMTGSESDLRIYPATLEIQPVETDTGNQVALVATAKSGDTLQPLIGATVSVYVTRMFSRLKVGEGTTDETGAVQIEIPEDLPGDEHSILDIIALIEETDEYGTLSAAMTKPWGQPVSHEIKKAPRALWSPNPPSWMIVTFFILMGTVWGHYLVIVFQLFRVKAAGKKESKMN
jgi:hypothetical protein